MFEYNITIQKKSHEFIMEAETYLARDPQLMYEVVFIKPLNKNIYLRLPK